MRHCCYVRDLMAGSLSTLGFFLVRGNCLCWQSIQCAMIMRIGRVCCSNQMWKDMFVMNM